METVPSWFWLVIVGLGQLAVALSVLWYFARRALLEDADAAKRPRRRRSIMRVLEHRLEQLLLKPPQWRQVLRRAQPYLFGGLGVALGSLAAWAIWSHAGSWFSAPAVVRHSDPSAASLPWESALEQVSHSAATLIPNMMLICGILAVGLSFLVRDGRHAMVGLGMVFLSFPMRALPSLLDELTSFDAPPISRPLSTQAASPIESHESAATVESQSSETDPETARSDMAAEQVAGPESEAQQEPVGVEQPERVPPPGSAVAPQHSSSRTSDEHIGVGDALMMYGAYRLLTHESAPRTPTVIYAPASTPSAARSQPAQSPHVSAPAPAPTYKPFVGRVSAIRASPVRSTPVFRSTGRRSR